MKILILLTAVLLISIIGNGQNPSLPPYAQKYNLDLSHVNVFDSGIDHEAKRKEMIRLKKKDPNSNRSYREIAPSYKIFIKENATLFTIENGTRRVWILKVISRHAKVMNLKFDNYNVGHTASLYFYTKGFEKSDGKYDNSWNNEYDIFSSQQFEDTDEIFVEYSELVDEPKKCNLRLSNIYHTLFDSEEDFDEIENGRGAINPKLRTSELEKALCRQLDFYCYANNSENASPIERQLYTTGKGVVHFRLKSGPTEILRFGSGVLLNNTASNNKILIATAYHVFHGNNSQVDVNLVNADVFFNYNNDKSECCDINLKKIKSTLGTGIKILLEVPDADFMLLELTGKVPNGTELTLLGWNIKGLTLNQPLPIKDFKSPYFCLHHPDGNQKKVAISDAGVTGFVNNNTGKGTKKAISLSFFNRSAKVKCLIEQGSSGSPLLDNDMYVFGIASLSPRITLDVECSDQNWQDGNVAYFSSLSDAWTLSPSNNKLGRYLDPSSTGIQKCISKGIIFVNGQPNSNRLAADDLPSGCSNLQASFFTRRTNMGLASTLVPFINTTSGGVYPISYEWTFGDEEKNHYAPERENRDPSHDYNSGECKKYSVTLKAEDALGNVSYAYVPNYITMGCDDDDWFINPTDVMCNKCHDETFSNRNFCGGFAGSAVTKAKVWVKCRNWVHIADGCNVSFAAGEFIEIESIFTAEEGSVFDAVIEDCNKDNFKYWFFGTRYKCIESPSWFGGRIGAPDDDTNISVEYITDGSASGMDESSASTENALYALISPNPATDNISIIMPKHKYTWEMSSMLGTHVKQSSAEVAGVDNISISDLASGIYVVKVRTSDGQELYLRFQKR